MSSADFSRLKAGSLNKIKVSLVACFGTLRKVFEWDEVKAREIALPERKIDFLLDVAFKYLFI